MLSDRKHFRLGMKDILGRSKMAAGGDAKCFALNALEFDDAGFADIRRPNRSSVVDGGLDAGFVEGEKGFLATTPRRPCERLHDVELLAT